MIPPKTILVPTDFSEAADAALAYAVSLAEKTNASIHLMHTFTLPLVDSIEDSTTSSLETEARIIGAIGKALDELVAKHAGRSVVITTFTKRADPREAILAAANEIGADLLVMGTHGRRGIARALIGSTTEAMVRTSPVPVLTVRPSQG